MNQHDDVALSAAVPVPLAVFVEPEPEPGRSVDLDRPPAFLEEVFPRFMRPDHVRVVDRLPRTPTNKIEKYRLKQEFLAET